MSHVIGIDLGTTNSCVAVMEGKHAIVIADGEGCRMTPSTVAFSASGECLVGKVAHRQTIRNPKNTIFDIKRLLGRTLDDSEVERMRSWVPYEIVPFGSGERKIPGVRIGEKIFSPQEITAIILKNLRESAEAYLGDPVEQAVITVPACFNNAQRQAILDAGRIAGLEVLSVIHEPTAAALGAGLGEDKNETVIVYAMGGGTFSVSVLRISQDNYEVISTIGDTCLGGQSFDDVIIDCIVAEVLAEHAIHLRHDLTAMYRLREAVEIARRELSCVEVTEIGLPFLTLKGNMPFHLERVLTRLELEDMTRHLVEKTIPTCARVLSEAGIERQDVTQIMFVGGMTRMPMVRERIARFFKLEDNQNVSPDEIAAIGACMYGNMLKGELQEVGLMDVTPLTLGVETQGGIFMPLIPRNTPIPCEVVEVFSTTVDFQEMASIHILQGERALAAENTTLAKLELWDLPPLLRGMPKLEVTFKINALGMVQVFAREQTTRQEVSIKIEDFGKLTDHEIAQILARAQAQKDDDDCLLERIHKINQAKEMLHIAERSLKHYGAFLDPSDARAVRTALENDRDYLDSDPELMLTEDVEDLICWFDDFVRTMAECVYATMNGS